MNRLPRQAGKIFYKPRITFTKTMEAHKGRTNAIGDTEIGTQNFVTAEKAAIQIRIAVYHEAVHRFLTPKLQIFREFRVYLNPKQASAGAD